MKAYDAYRTYLALKRHFELDSYDYHRYNGVVKASAESFEKRTDVKQFLKISRHSDPLNLMIGNFILSPNAVVPYNINQEYFLEFEKMKSNMVYNFKRDIPKFRPNLVENLNVDEKLSTPYIINLLMKQEISFTTACIFEGIFGCNEKWSKKEEYLLFETTSKKISKSWEFFNIQIDKYKRAVQTVFLND